MKRSREQTGKDGSLKPNWDSAESASSDSASSDSDDNAKHKPSITRLLTKSSTPQLKQPPQGTNDALVLPTLSTNPTLPVIGRYFKQTATATATVPSPMSHGGNEQASETPVPTKDNVHPVTLETKATATVETPTHVPAGLSSIVLTSTVETPMAMRNPSQFDPAPSLMRRMLPSTTGCFPQTTNPRDHYRDQYHSTFHLHTYITFRSGIPRHEEGSTNPTQLGKKFHPCHACIERTPARYSPLCSFLRKDWACWRSDPQEKPF